MEVVFEIGQAYVIDEQRNFKEAELFKDRIFKCIFIEEQVVVLRAIEIASGKILKVVPTVSNTKKYKPLNMSANDAQIALLKNLSDKITNEVNSLFEKIDNLKQDREFIDLKLEELICEKHNPTN